VNIKNSLLTLNKYSRPGTIRPKTFALIMHWTGVPMQSAKDVRRFFENRKDGKNGYGSAQYIVDLDGSIVRCIPDIEFAYHVGSDKNDPASGKIYTDWARSKFGIYASNNITPNACTIGIEMCTMDAAGNFSDETLTAASELATDICSRYKLNPFQDIGTHWMVVGYKSCPKLWTEFPIKLKEFRACVASELAKI
jgi:N-acetylmuramoyl-L-alanine amidase